MKIKNDLVRIKVGKKKYDFHNLILNEYLRRFALGQIDKENTLKGKLTQSRELNYILLKLDTSLEITESSKLYYNDFDICIINQAKHFQDLSENQITIQYNYKTKDNTFVVDISVSSQATETTSGSIKFLNNFYGKKITAIGFYSGWAPWANYSICAVLDTSNYNIYLEENQEFSVTRRDIITTDAEFYSNDKDKVPAPVHLAPYGVPQIINQPDIVDSEGTINSFYDNAYGALYSIGKGYMPNVIEEEKIIGENAKVVNNGTSLTISSVENEDVGTEALYPSEDLYPIGKFIEEIQTSEKGIQVSIKGNEEDAFVKIDGKSTQATRSGKNLFDANAMNNSNIESISKDGSSIIFKIMSSGNGLIGNVGKLSDLCPSLKVGDKVYLFFDRSNEQYNNYIYLYGSQYIWYKTGARVITQEDLDGNVGLYANRYSSGETEQVIISNLMITKENDNTWEQYGASPTPEFPSEIKSVGDDVNLFDINAITDNAWLLVDGTVETGKKNYCISDFIEIQQLTNYVLPALISRRLKYYDKDKNPLKTNDWDIASADTQQIITTPENAKYIRFTISKQNVDLNTLKFQKGDKATPYSKYGKGTVTIEQRGKNLFDCANSIIIYNNGSTKYERLENGLKLISNGLQYNMIYFLVDTVKNLKDKTLTLSSNISFLKDNQLVEFGLYYVKNDASIRRALYANSNITSEGKYQVIGQVEEGENRDYVCIGLRPNMASNFASGDYTIYDNLQVEIGETATDYEPYFSKDYVIPLSAPLRSLPNGTKDTIEADGIHRRVGSVVLDGNSNISMLVAKTNSAIFQYYDTSINTSSWDINILPSVMSNYFENINWHLLYNNVIVSDNAVNQIALHDTEHKIMIGTNIALTLEEFKTWLQQNPITVQYELAKEVVEPFTDEQLEVINSIETQKGTNIFSVNNELNPEIQVTEYISPLYPIKDNYKYIILKYKVWQEVATGEYTEEDGYIQEITDTGYYYHQAVPLEEYGTLNTTIKYERG